MVPRTKYSRIVMPEARRLRISVAGTSEDHRSAQNHQEHRDYVTRDAIVHVAEIVQEEENPKADQKNPRQHKYLLSSVQVIIEQGKSKEVY
jgi:hypothetical protein